MTKVYVGDIGTLLQLDTGQPLSGATSVSIEVRKMATGVEVSLPGVVVSSTKVQVTSVADTFDVAGEWLLQAKVVLPSGTWLGETVPLRIYPKFG